jgi:hypothetical protein
MLLDSDDPVDARQRILEQRLISARTDSAAKRVVLEILSRLAFLSVDGLDLVANGNSDEARQTLWIACCRRYPIIRNFAESVLVEASRSAGVLIDARTVEVFFLNEEISHSELASASVGTKYKLRQVLKLMLHQVGLINDTGLLIRGLAQPKVTTWLDLTPADKILLGGLRT